MENKYPSNPFIAETCEHYPKRIADSYRIQIAWIALAGRKPMTTDCECGDCFYCDGI